MGSRRAVERTTRSSTIQTLSQKAASSERDGASDAERRRERPLTTIDRKQLDDIVQYAKKQRTVTVLIQEKVDILLLQAKLRHEHHEQMAKAPNDRRVEPARVTARVAGLFNHQKEFVGKVWGDYWNGVSQQAARVPANYLPKPMSVPRVHAVTTLVQTFVRQRRSLRQRTTAKDIRELLVIHGYMSVNGESNTELSSSLRSVQRYLKFLGYKRGSKKGGVSYRLREKNQRKRDEYVSLMRAVNKKQVQRVVYLDESYIHHNYARHDDSLFDPNDEQDINIAVHHKGKRFCFIAAILDCDRSVPEDQRNEAQRSQLLHESIDVFGSGKKQTKDYHGMFNGPYFEQWMEKLMTALASRGIQSAVIALDNAKYHKRLPEVTPKGTTPKKEMQAKCDEYSVAFEPHELKGALWAKLKEHV